MCKLRVTFQESLNSKGIYNIMVSVVGVRATNSNLLAELCSTLFNLKTKYRLIYNNYYIDTRNYNYLNNKLIAKSEFIPFVISIFFVAN